jgi:putative flavoprotein involved in K+ transport
VGGHTRIPRRYRGLDIYWWLDQMGTFQKSIDDMPDPERARREPSLQLVGRGDSRTLDLVAIQDLGVRLAGRLTGIDGHHVRFADDLAITTAAADQRMRRLLGEIDDHIAAAGLSGEVLDAEPLRPPVTARPLHELTLHTAGVTSVVWATGFERPYPWLHLPVLDRRGEIRQRRGVTPVDGLYVLGQRFQHTRSSNFIDGVRHDAELVADHLSARPRRLAGAAH